MKKSIIVLLTLFMLAGNELLAQNALNFDGSDDGVNCGTGTALNIGGTSFSVEAWIYANSWNANPYQGTIAIKESNSNNGGFMLRAGGNGQINFAMGAGSSSAWVELTTASKLTTGAWYHIAATYDGSFMRIYVNGTLADSLATTISSGGAASTPLTIGYHPTYTGRVWNGLIDELRLWDTVLTKAAINAGINKEFCAYGIPHLKGYFKLDEGTPRGNNSGKNTTKDYSGYGNDGTLYNFSLSGASSNWDYGKVLSQDTVYFTDKVSRCGPYFDAEIGKYITTSTKFTRHLPSFTGCDSSVTKDITIKNISRVAIDRWVCDSFISATGKTYTQSGTYYDILTNAEGCDSIITLTLKVGADSSEKTVEHCQSYYSDGGNTYNQTGTYFEHFKSFMGCDSVVKLHVTIYPPMADSITLYTCDSVMNLKKTKWLKPGNTVSDTFKSVHGCDSIMHLWVKSLKSTATIETAICNSYKSPSGKIITLSGTFADTIKNYRNCDSLISVKVTILQPSSGTVSIDACFQTKLPNGLWINQSGVYYDTAKNIAGCDSFIMYDVTIKTVNTGVTVEAQKLTAQSTTGTFQWLDCNKGFSAISGETKAVFETTAGGNYAAEVTENNCVDTTACYVLKGAGTANKNIFTIQVVPNPAGNRFTIFTNEIVGEAKLTITDSKGCIIWQDVLLNTNQYSFSQPLVPGLYVIALQVDNRLYYRRLQIVER